MSELRSVEALQDRVDDLEEEVRYWRAEAERLGSDDQRIRFRTAFAIPLTESRILAALYARGSQPFRVEDMEATAPPSDHVLERNDNVLLKIMIHRLRKKIGRNAIICIRSEGYILSEEGRRLCEEAVRLH